MKKTFLSALMVASASVLMLASCNDEKKTAVSTETATDTTKVAEAPAAEATPDAALEEKPEA